MAAPTIPASYYHMSGQRFAERQIIRANGQEKLPDEFEVPLEEYRPPNLSPRREFVYCRPDTDFSRCGIVDPKYIYRVDPAGKLPQIHDLGWIGDMQKARLKQKHPDKLGHYPDWSCKLVKACCEGYWSGKPTESPVWEYLFPCVRVVEVISDQLVDPRATKNGWRPP
jgi:hypothetical protein